ncbi:MAG: glycosyltransferase [Micromonosporaceae bacterium]|nr:glycosyltransferase [Micromonosporaceae bacterium]
MVSVVIAAHNEQAVLGRTLDALLGDGPDGLDVTVVANGCTDGTAAVARARPGVRVIELAEASKPSALNAGDAVAVGFPRVYLDADISLPGAAVRRLAAAVSGSALAAVPRRRLILTGRPLLVRAYYAVHTRLPVFAAGLFGRGVITLSAAGRARFDRFPDMIADDLFLDSRFTDAERRAVPEVEAPVATPLRTRDLLRRLARVRAGNAAMRDAAHGTRRASRLSWLRDVVLSRPWLAPAAVCYVGLTVTAALLARRRTDTWARDESSRAGGG